MSVKRRLVACGVIAAIALSGVSARLGLQSMSLRKRAAQQKLEIDVYHEALLQTRYDLRQPGSSARKPLSPNERRFVETTFAREYRKAKRVNLLARKAMNGGMLSKEEFAVLAKAMEKRNGTAFRWLKEGKIDRGQLSDLRLLILPPEGHARQKTVEILGGVRRKKLGERQESN